MMRCCSRQTPPDINPTAAPALSLTLQHQKKTRISQSHIHRQITQSKRAFLMSQNHHEGISTA
ncbi:hypothetical protein BDQ17DRAFT_1358871 [Cyathus striatus]|nr:hypothetical protein BDQ17DRAFT_1358871 [Cyathus striatus]